MRTQRVLTAKQITKAAAKLELFAVTPKQTKLTAQLSFDSHVEALVFIARVTVHAEVLQHHPDITFTYCAIKISIQTHEVRGLTKKDFELAAKIEKSFAYKRG